MNKNKLIITCFAAISMSGMAYAGSGRLADKPIIRNSPSPSPTPIPTSR